MIIYLVRHGQTDWNKQEKIQGIIDNELNSTGKKQAKEISSFFLNKQIDTVYSSSLNRAIDTANIALNNAYPLEINDAFIERNFGVLEGENVQKYYEVEDYSKISGFETHESILKRVDNGLQSIIKQNQKESTIAIFTHCHILKSSLILYDTNDNDFSIKIPNCGILELKATNNNISVVKLHCPIT